LDAKGIINGFFSLCLLKSQGIVFFSFFLKQFHYLWPIIKIKRHAIFYIANNKENIILGF
jgi:hypothetical protein